jgi:hypothetical protein
MLYRVRTLVAKFAISLLKATGFYDSYWSHWRGPIFGYAEAKGVHILPVHYYSPIPQIAAGDFSADRRSSFAVDIAQSRERLSTLLQTYGPALRAIFAKADKGPHDYDPANMGFSPVDAAVLFGMVYESKPCRIIEIGSGSSTLVIAAAIRAAQATSRDYRPVFTCIEPYVPSYLQPPPREVTEILAQPLQTIPLSRFTELGAGDLLFIDSTHVVSYGSDVVYEYLEIVPRLSVGVTIHVHDIFLPYDYPPRWLTQDRFFWNEQYLLQALLTMNPNFRVDLAVNAAVREMDPGDMYAHSIHSTSLWVTRV